MDEFKTLIGKVATGATLTREEAASRVDEPDLRALHAGLPPTRGERVLRTLAAFGRTRGRLVDDRGPAWAEWIRAATGRAALRTSRSRHSAIAPAIPTGSRRSKWRQSSTRS